jgi:hypothetical protein
MSTYLEEWIDLVDRIVETDIVESFNQKEVISSIINNPLPLDRTAGRDFQFMEQFVLTSETTRMNLFHCTIRTSRTEYRGIYCANGATGMGKTHLAYSLGETGYVVMIRAMEQGTDHISEPWSGPAERSSSNSTESGKMGIETRKWS